MDSVSIKAPRHMSRDTVIGRLNLEWAGLRDDSGANSVAGGWAGRYSALAGLSSLPVIEETVRGAGPERADEILHALVGLAGGEGEQGALASRVVLQLMLPKVVLIARAGTRLLPDLAERQQLSVSSMYEAIRTFPVHRHRRFVPSYLAWNTHRAVRRAIRAQTAEVPIDAQSIPLPAAPLNAGEELAYLLVWAVSEEVISLQDAELLAARYGGPGQDTPTWKTIGDLSSISRASGLSPDAVKQRCSRARRRLTVAVPAYPGPAQAMAWS